MWGHIRFGVCCRAKIARMEKPNKPKRIETTLRLPPELHDELVTAGAKAGRSANEEIIHRCKAHAQAVALDEIVRQNAELRRMVQVLIDRLD
jgi:predicted HicB family RNase H-like nuclease